MARRPFICHIDRSRLKPQAADLHKRLQPKPRPRPAQAPPTTRPPLGASSSERQLDQEPANRWEQVRARMAAEDAALDDFNRDVIHHDDPLRGLKMQPLVEQFTELQDVNVQQLVQLLLAETAAKNAIPQVQKIFNHTVGSSVKIDPRGVLSRLVERLHETKFVEAYSALLNLEESTRARLLEQYLAKNWGPALAEPVQVSVDNKTENGSPNSRRSRRHRPDEGQNQTPAAGVGKSRGDQTPLTTPINHNPWVPGR